MWLIEITTPGPTIHKQTQFEMNGQTVLTGQQWSMGHTL